MHYTIIFKMVGVNLYYLVIIPLQREQSGTLRLGTGLDVDSLSVHLSISRLIY